MFNFQDIDFKKEIERIKKEDPGNIRGSLIISIHDYIVLSKGEEGWKMVMDELRKAEFDLPDFQEINNMIWVPSSVSTILFIAAGRAFNWNEDDMFEVGRNYIALPLSVKLFIKYFISVKKTIELGARSWKKQYTFGEVELIECNMKQRRIVVRKKGDPRHPLFCSFHMGVFARIVEISVAAKVTAEETECIFKGGAYHEFIFKW